MSSVTLNAEFADNPAFLEYQDLLIQIQHAICRGDNQTANRLCDASEDLEQSLSLAEIQWLQWLSSDLEMLCGEELLQPTEQTEQEYANNLTQAWLNIREQPEKVLFLLRRNRGYLSQSRVAYARAIAYGILGYNNLRHEFLLCASNFDPQNAAYKTVLMVSRMDVAVGRGDVAESMVSAEAILHNSASPPLIILMAACNIYLITGLMPVSEARPVLGKLRKQVQSILDEDKRIYLEPKVAVFGLLILGGILEGLSRKSAAKASYLKAIALDPQDDGPLIALGSLLAETDQGQALLAFEKAIDLKTNDVLPYLHLALREMNDANYPQAAHLAEQALIRKTPPRVTAFAHEILAISELGVAGLTEGAFFHFERAVSLAPEIGWMRQNYTEALELRNNQDQSQVTQQARLMLKDFKQQALSSDLGVDAKEFLSKRLTSLSALTSKNESSTLALAA